MQHVRVMLALSTALLLGACGQTPSGMSSVGEADPNLSQGDSSSSDNGSGGSLDDIESLGLSAQGYGLKDTFYPTPGGATFVATGGSDTSGNGSIGSPYKTLARAITDTPAGGTIVLRGGTYRMNTTVVNKPLTIQPYYNPSYGRNARVWLKGSLEVKGWTAAGGDWSANWFHPFSLATQLEWGCPSGDCIIDPAHPQANHRDQLFVDGQALRQVLSRGEVVPGTFYVDTGDKKLFANVGAGVDPDSRLMEGTAYERGLDTTRAADGAKIRGVGFAHYAEQGVRVYAPNITLENNTFSWNAIRGASLNGVPGGTDATVKGNSFVLNGAAGLSGGHTTNTVIDGNRFIGNNSFERFRTTWGSAGLKLVNSRDVKIFDNVLEGNVSHGIWLDASVIHPIVVRNTVKGTGSNAGIFLEISPGGPRGAIIASNVVSGAGAGIQIGNSNNARIWNNTLVGNNTNLVVNKGNRKGEGEQGTEVLPVTDTIAKNNLFSDPSGGTTLRASKFDACADPAPLFDTLNFNAYHRSSASDPATLIQWAPVAGASSCSRSFASTLR